VTLVNISKLEMSLELVTSSSHTNGITYHLSMSEGLTRLYLLNSSIDYS
jgi:hypothetical protein